MPLQDRFLVIRCPSLTEISQTGIDIRECIYNHIHINQRDAITRPMNVTWHTRNLLQQNIKNHKGCKFSTLYFRWNANWSDLSYIAIFQLSIGIKNHSPMLGHPTQQSAWQRRNLLDVLLSASVTLWRQLQTRFIPCESSDQCTNMCSDSVVFFVVIPQMHVSVRKHVNSDILKCHSYRCHLILSVYFYTRSK